MSNSKTVQAIYAAFGRGDVPAILEHIGEDCLWEYQPTTTDVPYLQARRGRGGVAEFLQTLGTEVQVTKFEVTAVLESARIVVALLNVDGTIKKTGKSWREVDEAHVWHFDERGKVVKFRHCADTHAHYLACQP